MAEFGEEGLEVFLEQIERFQAELKEISEDLPREMDRATEHTADKLKAEMKANIRKHDAIDSGSLISSVSNEQLSSATAGGRSKWSVGPTAEHAPYVEYGTGKHTIWPDGSGPEEYEKALEAEPTGDDYLSDALKELPALKVTTDQGTFLRHKVEHPGSPKQPFFHPSVNRAETEEWFEREIEKHTKGLFTAELS